MALCWMAMQQVQRVSLIDRRHSSSTSARSAEKECLLEETCKKRVCVGCRRGLPCKTTLTAKLLWSSLQKPFHLMMLPTGWRPFQLLCRLCPSPIMNANSVFPQARSISILSLDTAVHVLAHSPSALPPSQRDLLRCIFLK